MLGALFLVLPLRWDGRWVVDPIRSDPGQQAAAVAGWYGAFANCDGAGGLAATATATTTTTRLGSLVAAMATVLQTMLLPAKLSICHGRSIVDWWRCMIADGTPSLVLLVRAVSQMSLSLGSGPAASACFFALPQLPSIYPLLRFSSSSSSSLLGSSAVACPDLRVCARSSVDPRMQVTCYQKSNDTVAEKALSTHLS